MRRLAAIAPAMALLALVISVPDMRRGDPRPVMRPVDALVSRAEAVRAFERPTVEVPRSDAVEAKLVRAGDIQRWEVPGRAPLQMAPATPVWLVAVSGEIRSGWDILPVPPSSFALYVIDAHSGRRVSAVGYGARWHTVFDSAPDRSLP